MFLRKDKKNKRRLFFIVILAIVLIGAGVAAYFIFTNSNDPTKSYKPEYDISKNNDDPQSEEGKKESVKDTPQDDRTNEEIPVAPQGTVSITDLNQRDGYVNVAATTANFETQKCVYSFISEGARPVTREQSGNCQATSIPQAEFDKIGSYTLHVTAYDTTSKITASQTINIQ